MLGSFKDVLAVLCKVKEEKVKKAKWEEDEVLVLVQSNRKEFGALYLGPKYTLLGEWRS